MLFTVAKKSVNIWATLVRKIVSKNLQKLPNLVSLVRSINLRYKNRFKKSNQFIILIFRDVN